MIVVHIESGLGNQMLSYCEYLALKKMNPEADLYIETMIYEFPECDRVICQWNGYELERIFGIHAPDIKGLFSDEDWNLLLSTVRKSAFWDRNWNYPVCFTEAFQKAGIPLKNCRGDFEAPGAPLKTGESTSLKSRLRRTRAGYLLRSLQDRLHEQELLAAADETACTFLRTEEDIFTGQRLSFAYRNNGIEKIDGEIREAFAFPPFADQQNKELAAFLQNSESVFIHARRGDMLDRNQACYRYGYFKRAVRYMKAQLKNPVFIVFSDPGGVQWCRQNLRVFALDPDRDTVLFVDWNTGPESYRDMQLMTCCRHGIITNSSFGWWGTWLMDNPDKITCSPDLKMNTTHHF